MQRRYLKDAVNKAGYSSQPLSVFERLDRASADATVELMALLTRRLVLGEEGGDGMDDGSTVLHFVPTMMMIEGLYRLLEDMLPGVPLYVLHSSIDIDDCMAALMGEDGAPVRHCSSKWAAARHTPVSPALSFLFFLFFENRPRSTRKKTARDTKVPPAS